MSRFQQEKEGFRIQDSGSAAGERTDTVLSVVRRCCDPSRTRTNRAVRTEPDLLKSPRRFVGATKDDMFKKTKSKVLVDYASEEDDMTSWHYHHSYKEKEAGEEEEEQVITAASKEAKVKKIMSKKERKGKKMLSSKDDEHFLLTGVKLTDRKGPHKKLKDDEKEKKDKADKGYCFWDSVTMTMRQISPAKKLEKMEGWEPPQLGNLTETVNDEPLVTNSQKGELAVSLPDSISIPVEIPSWGGRGFEEDSSRYANLTDSNDSAAAVRWTSRAKVKLAGISRMSRGIVSENSWGGFK